jgi:hypothetical protein
MNGGLGGQRADTIVGERSDGEVQRRAAWTNSGESPRMANDGAAAHGTGIRQRVRISRATTNWALGRIFLTATVAKAWHHRNSASAAAVRQLRAGEHMCCCEL